MNLVDQFTEQHISCRLGSHLLQQLQGCHSAVEDLILHLESLRGNSSLTFIEEKIKLLGAYLATKKQLLTILEKRSSAESLVWLKSKSSSSFTKTLLEEENGPVLEMMERIIKKVFLREKSLEGFIEETQTAEKCDSLFRQIKQNILAGRTPPRQMLRQADSLWQILQQRIRQFGSQRGQFNREMQMVSQQLDEFSLCIKKQFQDLLLRR